MLTTIAFVLSVVQLGLTSVILARVMGKRDPIELGEQTMSAIDDLIAATTANTDATKAAADAIKNLADQVHAAAGNEDQVKALAAQIKGNAETLAAAITANTPAAPAEPTG